MNGQDELSRLPGRDLVSDALGALSLGVLLLGAQALPHLI